MIDILKKVLATICILCAGLFIGWLCRGHFTPDLDTLVKTDTLVVKDTVVERCPQIVTVMRLDTLLVAIRDTITLHDTTYVVIDREQKYYKGEDYEAWISGYRPALDSIWVYPETRYITKEIISNESRKRWGIGIQAGYGIGISERNVKFFPYVGIGLSYELICW